MWLVTLYRWSLQKSQRVKFVQTQSQLYLLQKQDLVVMAGEAVQVGGAVVSHGLTQALPKFIQLPLKVQLVLGGRGEHAGGSLHERLPTGCHGCIVCAGTLLQAGACIHAANMTIP